CALLPSCAGLTLAGSRPQAAFMRSVVARHVFPHDYEPALPVYPSSRFCLEAARQGERAIATLPATPERLRNIDSWRAGQASPERRLVTVTLRDYDYMPARNSNIEAWTAFARGLDPHLYLAVIVPDTDHTIAGLPAGLADFVLLPEAAWSVGLRMALYQ